MLDKNVVKYININIPPFIWGQKADGTWYCKEFKSETVEEEDGIINNVNVMLNKYNIKEDKEKDKVKKKKEDKIVLDHKKDLSNVKI